MKFWKKENPKASRQPEVREEGLKAAQEPTVKESEVPGYFFNTKDVMPVKKPEAPVRTQKSNEVVPEGMTAEQVLDQTYQKTIADEGTGRKTFKLKISYNKKRCIGAGQCVLADPYDFVLDDMGLADLKEGKEQGGLQIKNIETQDPALIMNAAKACPALVISVFDAVTGKKIAPTGRKLPQELMKIEKWQPTTKLNDIPIITESPLLKKSDTKTPD